MALYAPLRHEVKPKNGRVKIQVHLHVVTEVSFKRNFNQKSFSCFQLIPVANRPIDHLAFMQEISVDDKGKVFGTCNKNRCKTASFPNDVNANTLNHLNYENCNKNEKNSLPVTLHIFILRRTLFIL